MNRVSIILFFKGSRPGLANILRARAHGNFEEHNVLESFTVIINYFSIIINAYYS